VPRQQLALLLHEVAVHEEQALQRHVGGETPLARQVRAREVEELQVFVEAIAADPSVDGAAIVRRRERLGGTAHLPIDRARDGEQRVSDLFRGQPMAVGAPVQPVARILLEALLRMLAAQLVDRAEHDFAVQLFDRESVVDEPLRQILEQFRIRGTLAVDPEIARRVDNPGYRNVLSHTRLTRTRSAIGSLTMASASSRRPLPFVNGAGVPGLNTDRKWRGTSSPRLNALPRLLTFRSIGFSASLTPWTKRVVRRLCGA